MADSERTSPNVVWHPGDVDRDERWRATGTAGATVWFTGLSGVAFILVSLWSSLRYRKRHAAEA